MELNSLIGTFPSKIVAYNDATLVVFLKKKPGEDYAQMKIVFKDVVTFHETGVIGKQLNYADISSPGFSASEYARQKGLDPAQYNQHVLMAKSETSTELIVVSKTFQIITDMD